MWERLNRDVTGGQALLVCLITAAVIAIALYLHIGA